MTSPWLSRVWLAYNAIAVTAGWILSGAGLLNRTAYAVLFAAGLAGAVLWFSRQSSRRVRPMVLCRRWRSWPALTFLLLVSAGVVGGCLYAPNNIDALAYRTPRVLHWLAEGRWHWIPAPYQRLNTRACGFEWATAPVFAILKSDRPLFLLNIAAYCLLPGFIFTILREVGVGGRAAVAWMWLFPTGYCFALQAGSIGNDLHGATLSAAAFAWALQARRHRDPVSAAWSCVAISLMTGAKSSNIPLLLPWAFAVWPAIAPLLRRPLLAAVTASLALVTSLAPISILNQMHTGDWTGLKVEDAWIRPPGPLICAAHNAGLLATQNLLPPILPGAGAINATVERILPESWKLRVDAFAENGRAAYAVREIPGEEHAGLGFGVSWLLILTLVHGLRRGRKWLTPFAHDRVLLVLVLLPWVALAPYLARSGITTAGRILAPYYPWLLPAILVLGSAGTAVRERWFHYGTRAASILVLALVVLIPSRPLWPARTILSLLRAASGSRAIERASTVYEVYARRADVLAPLRKWIPDNSPTIGFVTVNDAEASLWKPYGHQRVRHLLISDRIEDLRSTGLRCVVANSDDFIVQFRRPVDEWVKDHGGRIVGRESIPVLAREPPREFVVIVW